MGRVPTFASYGRPRTQPEVPEHRSDQQGYVPLCHCARWQSELHFGNVQRSLQPQPYGRHREPDAPMKKNFSSFSISPCHPSYVALAFTMTGLSPVRLRYPSLGTLNSVDLTPGLSLDSGYWRAISPFYKGFDHVGTPSNALLHNILACIRIKARRVIHVAQRSHLLGRLRT